MLCWDQIYNKKGSMSDSYIHQNSNITILHYKKKLLFSKAISKQKVSYQPTKQIDIKTNPDRVIISDRSYYILIFFYNSGT